VIDQRLVLPVTADERTLLTCFLDFQRDALVRKCVGLSDEQLRLRSVPSSNVSLVGLVRHLAEVERWYFQSVIDGNYPGGLFTATDDREEDFNDIGSATGDFTIAIWRAQVEQSRRISDQLPLETIGTVPLDPVAAAEGTSDPTHGRQYTLRWVLVHMIDEYARHLGHADIIREAIDGEVGE
jgi:hypothetical protein